MDEVDMELLEMDCMEEKKLPKLSSREISRYMKLTQNEAQYRNVKAFGLYTSNFSRQKALGVKCGPIDIRWYFGISMLASVVLYLVEHDPAKTGIRYARFCIGLPFLVTGYVYNRCFTVVDKKILGKPFPVNLTDTYGDGQ